jgi:hypothetical protein
VTARGVGAAGSAVGTAVVIAVGGAADAVATSVAVVGASVAVFGEGAIFAPQDASRNPLIKAINADDVLTSCISSWATVVRIVTPRTPKVVKVLQIVY